MMKINKKRRGLGSERNRVKEGITGLKGNVTQNGRFGNISYRIGWTRRKISILKCLKGNELITHCRPPVTTKGSQREVGDIGGASMVEDITTVTVTVLWNQHFVDVTSHLHLTAIPYKLTFGEVSLH